MPSSTSRRAPLIYTLASAVVTVGVFAYLLSAVSFTEVLQLIAEVNRNALAMFVVLSLFATLMRTWRYQLLLGVSGFRPAAGALFLTVLVRNLFADLLPARIGSAIYLFIVTTRLGV
jgi:uncharacterized membrane protein YbhN (UPF0104 family)